MMRVEREFKELELNVYFLCHIKMSGVKLVIPVPRNVLYPLIVTREVAKP